MEQGSGMRSCISFLILIYAASGFSTAPLKIIEDWQVCQTKTHLDEKCIHVGHKALELKNLVESLEYNPQAFGLDIMRLQNQLHDETLSVVDRQKLQQALQLRLSIVGWLESPKS